MKYSQTCGVIFYIPEISVDFLNEHLNSIEHPIEKAKKARHLFLQWAAGKFNP
jgi:cation transport regulator ChaC